MDLNHWTPVEVMRKVARRAGYYKWKYIKDFPNVPNAVFIWIPKCGGTSMSTALGNIGMLNLKNKKSVRFYFSQHGLVTFNLMNYSDLLKEDLVSKSYHDSAFKFTISRNPYARAVSAYFFFKKKGVLGSPMSFKIFTSHLARLDFNIHRLGVPGTRDHLFPQIDYISHQGKAITDYIARLETIHEDVKVIQGELGIEFDYPHKNSTKHLDYQEYYDEESRNNIYKVYEKDFDFFKYPTKM